jgi:hypothetical protein
MTLSRRFALSVSVSDGLQTKNCPTVYWGAAMWLRTVNGQKDGWSTVWLNNFSAAMTRKERRSAFRRLPKAMLVLPLAAAIGLSQAQQRSPSDLIRYLTWQSDRPGMEELAATSNACGAAVQTAQENRPAIRALVELGTSAIPDLEATFDVIETRSLQSGFAGYAGPLFLAYAQIKGPAAYPRLHKMIGNPQFDFPLDTVRVDLDNAIASSFGLTSYVSAIRTPVRMLHCHGDRPQDALDQLILGWERGDRTWLEGQLGPNAAAALDSLLEGKTWPGVRAELWRGKSNPGAAVGYRFQNSGTRSESRQSQEGQVQPASAPLGAARSGSLDLDLDTLFESTAGSYCGSYRVRFSNAQTYLVDNPDIEDLLRLIASCAAGPDARQ